MRSGVVPDSQSGKTTRGVISSKPATRLQSAMEYLLTYGWTILIIAVVIVAFYSYGVFGLASRTSGAGCLPVSGFTCTQPVLISSGALTAGVGIIGQTITIRAVGCSLNSTAPKTWVSTVITLGSGQISRLTFICPVSSSTATASSVFRGTLWINYTNGNSNAPISAPIAQVNLPVAPNATQTGGGVGTCLAASSTYTSPSGNPYTVIIPPNCGNVMLSLNGASGGTGEVTGGYAQGGYGSYITGNYAVKQGVTALYVWVGSVPSYGAGGGTPGGGSSSGAGGGGCSVVSTTNSIANPYVLIVGAGGGGGGSSELHGGQGGNGGAPGLAGAFGDNECADQEGGQGGTALLGGYGGVCVANTPGDPGSSYNGGAGANGGGGGGCGYFGGGGASGNNGNDAGGGGGGSSWANSIVVSNIIYPSSLAYFGSVTLTWYN